MITLSNTADDWELFSTEPGAGVAANALNREFERLVNETQDREQVRKGMDIVMDKYSHLGAYDTEPRWVLNDLLDKVFGKKFGY